MIDSGVDVVHGCFPKGGNSIKCLLLGALVSELRGARQLRRFPG